MCWRTPTRAGTDLWRSRRSSVGGGGICLWGTLIGSMLPLVFKRLGVDPGIASSPFVATFVDVTGIVIYFRSRRSGSLIAETSE